MIKQLLLRFSSLMTVFVKSPIAPVLSRRTLVRRIGLGLRALAMSMCIALSPAYAQQSRPSSVVLPPLPPLSSLPAPMLAASSTNAIDLSGGPADLNTSDARSKGGLATSLANDGASGPMPASREEHGNPVVSPIQVPPVPPTLFERFVTQTTGKHLPLFGYQFFAERDLPSANAYQNTPAPDDYVLGPGDEVMLRTWGGVDADLRLTVDRNGQISIPKVGVVAVAGTHASDLDATLKRAVGRYYTNFSLSASLGRLRSIQIYVVGRAAAPGAYTVSSLSTLVSALVAAGGPAPTGSLRAIQLRRHGAVVATVDMYDFLTQGSGKGDVHLLSGDVIVIPPAGPRVAVLGALDTPAIYELREQTESLGQVLHYAGGANVLTKIDKAQVERISPQDSAAPHSVETLSLDATGLSTPVRSGDVVTLFNVDPKFANAVTLRGNVAAPLRYPYSAGMTLADLIPSPEALLTPDYFLRKNVLVEFDHPRAPKKDVSNDVRNLVDEPNWGYAVVERINPVTLKENLIPFNLSDLVLKKDPGANLILQPGDVVTIFGKKDLRAPLADSTRLVRVDGEVRAPGVYQLHSNETLQQVIQRAGGVTPDAYLFGTVFTREATRAQQQRNLDEALQRAEQKGAGQLASAMANLPANADSKPLQTQMQQAQQAQLDRLRALKPSGRVSLELNPHSTAIADLPDLPLEDGDAIYVPPTPAFVTAMGAVDNDNALVWKPHRTVETALRVAGVQQDAANMRSAFVLRADGSVVSAGNTGWFKSFGGTDLMPGDTVVVPEKLDRRSPMTKFIGGLKDWSQVLANFGLGAAAIRVLK